MRVISGFIKDIKLPLQQATGTTVKKQQNMASHWPRHTTGNTSWRWRSENTRWWWWWKRQTGIQTSSRTGSPRSTVDTDQQPTAYSLPTSSLLFSFQNAADTAHTSTK